MTVRPMVLFFFGDPKGGRLLLNRCPSVATDLPLKGLIQKSPERTVLISYNSPECLQQRHFLVAPSIAR